MKRHSISFLLALGAFLLISCQEDRSTDSSGQPSQVSLAARLLVRPADASTFDRTVWVRARVVAEAVRDSALVPFDSGHHVFRSLPPNTPYKLTFTGYLADSATVVWDAEDSGNTGTGDRAVPLPVVVAPTPLFSTLGGTFAVPQSLTISASGTDSIEVSTDSVQWVTYAPPYLVSATGKVYAKSFRGGVAVSVVSYLFTIDLEAAADPGFSLASGILSGPRNLAISSSTSGAEIYYTTDGSDPTTASTKYVDSVLVSVSETVKAVAVKSGMADSRISSATYTISIPDTAKIPEFSPPEGTFTGARKVAITTATAGAEIFYTTNGSDPTAASTRYVDSVEVGATETLKAIAVKAGMVNSPVATGTYTISVPGTVDAPTFSPAGGSIAGARKVAITTSTAGADIYYTVDGSEPTTSSARYADSITVSATRTIKAMAFKSGLANSSVSTATFTFTATIDTAKKPVFDPAGGVLAGARKVAITTATAGAEIYYTTDGTAPTTNSTKYSDSILVGSAQTIKAIAVKAGMVNSPLETAVFTLSVPGTVDAPTFSPAAGTIASARKVAITSSTSGAEIYYTTNGTDPTTGSTKYVDSVLVSSTETIKAIAVKSGLTNSGVTTAIYILSAPDTAKAPSYGPAAGTIKVPSKVAITSATSGADIFYTTDGSVPTIASTKYVDSVLVSSTETIKAMAAKAGLVNSPVSQATYSLVPDTAKAPSYGPAAGTIKVPSKVAITSATSGADIFFTTDGTAPTTASTKYVDSVLVSSTETIKAIAVKAGLVNSPVSQATYSLVPDTARTPSFSLAAGTIASGRKVGLSSATAGADIYYTVDGTAPTTSSTKYLDSIVVTASETIKAIAVKSGFVNSPVSSTAYTVPPLPSIAPAGGPYTGTQTVTITIPATAGATIEDSLSTGSGWAPYNQALSIRTNIKVFARTKLNGLTSAIVEADYAFDPTLVDDVAGDTIVTGTGAVSVIVNAPGASEIWVTTDSLNWSKVASGSAVVMRASGVLQAYAKTGTSVSATVAQAINLFQRPPSISPAGGQFPTAQTVTITAPTTGTSFYYTTDGTAPTIHSTRYSGAFTVGASQTVNAIAVTSGLITSAPRTATFYIADTNTYGIPWNNSVAYGTVRDVRDGQVYRTVTIGAGATAHTWMAQNLNYAAVGSSCVALTETGPDTCRKYGRLYSWPLALGLPLDDTIVYSVATWDTHVNYQGICPTSWHVPSETEWSDLVNTVDPDALQLDVLRSSAGWGCSGRGCISGNGSDEFGFRGLPIDYSSTYWWTPTESDATTAVPVYLPFNSELYSLTPIEKNGKYPVRCVKN